MAEISFPVPAGFTPPEGIKEGQSFDFMASGYYKGPSMYLTAVEGNSVSGTSEAPKAEETNEEMGMAEAVEKGLAE